MVHPRALAMSIERILGWGMGSLDTLGFHEN